MRGYVGCLSCGSSIMRPKEGQMLADKCIPKDKKTSGSFHRVRRIAQGIHPYGPEHQWPNGSVSSNPQRVAHPRPSIAHERALRKWRWFGLHMLAKATAPIPLPDPPRKFKITKVWSRTWGPRGEPVSPVGQREPTMGSSTKPAMSD